MGSLSAIARKARRFGALTGKDRATLVRAWLLLLIVDRSLRRLPYLAVVERFGGARRAPTCPPDLELAVHLERLVSTAARYHVRPMLCLAQALTLRRMLSDLGMESDLKLGVRSEGGAFEAHAWLEVEGVPLGQPEDVRDRFKPLEGGR